MRIYYVNRRLTQYRSAPGLWGRKVLYGLRRAGAAVSSYPPVGEATDVSEPTPATAQLRPGAFERCRAFLRRRYSHRLIARLFETWKVARGIANTLVGTLWILWNRRGIDTDVVLGRQAEYEATPQLAAYLLRRPLVLEVHSIHFMERQMRENSGSRLLRAFERWEWRCATRIWVNSDQLKSIIVDNGIPENSVRVIPFGVDLERFAPRERTGADDLDEIRVVFVGSFFVWHGMEVLLRAFAAALEQNPDLRLTLVGDGTRRGSSEELARDLGIAEAVEFTGWISNDQVIEQLMRADIGVAPYLPIEPFYFDPAKIIEYMSAGLAVLASDQGRIPDMVENGVSGLLLPPGDETALTDALVRLARDKQLLRRLGGAARSRAEAIYNWSNISADVLKLCEEAMQAGATDRH
jgi:glycosyltransferase involved in cell wall biosynthesis